MDAGAQNDVLAAGVCSASYPCFKQNFLFFLKCLNALVNFREAELNWSFVKFDNRGNAAPFRRRFKFIYRSPDIAVKIVDGISECHLQANAKGKTNEKKHRQLDSV